MRTLLIAALLAACQKPDPGPSCDQVVDHLLEITKQNLPGHEGMNTLGDRKAMIQQCVQRAMAKEERQCLLAAKTIDMLASCRKSAPPVRLAPPPPLVNGSAGSGSAGAGSAGSGSAGSSSAGSGSG